MDTDEQPTGLGRIMLLDLDNCPRELLQLTNAADEYQFILACHGSAEPKVPLGMAAVIGELIASGKMQIVKMKQGKNAADFGLTFWAGKLSAELPDALFFIASKDKDLDFAIEMLRQQGCRAKRIPTAADATFTRDQDQANGKDQAVIEHRRHIKSFCEMLVRKKDSLPRKRQTLANFVKSAAPKNHDWAAALKLLETDRTITYTDKGVVQYHHQQFPGVVKKYCYKTIPPVKPDPAMEKLQVDKLPKPKKGRLQQAFGSKETSNANCEKRQPLLFDITDPIG